ncbi:prepilin peptidase [Vibrio variabilis]|uniref:prepilin peptidase n=1 Tax=Vibrio variabilis TaxID=990271 RepID=UPI003B838C01
MLFILCSVLSLCDIRRRVLPNKVIFLTLLLQISFLGTSELQFISFALTSVIFAALYCGKLIGGGDVKLLAVMSLALPLQWLFVAMFITAVAGGGLRLLMLVSVY